MEKIEKLVTFYVADDGMEFKFQSECQEHEDKTDKRIQRNMFLSNKFTEYLNEKYETTYFRVKIGQMINNNNTYIYYDKRELDEELDNYFPRNIWNELVKEFEINYLCEIRVPYWYWSK